MHYSIPVLKASSRTIGVAREAFGLVAKRQVHRLLSLQNMGNPPLGRTIGLAQGFPGPISYSV